MDAAALMTALTDAIDAHHWDALPGLLHPEFSCHLLHTGERFDARQWVRLNAEYPGFGRMVVEDRVDAPSRTVVLASVTGTDADGKDQHFAVASFLTEQDGLVHRLTEVWTEVDQTPPAGTRPA